ncbi:MAG: hypothetical protein ACUVYA_15535 [Planctomycetota bacterium]
MRTALCLFRLVSAAFVLLALSVLLAARVLAGGAPPDGDPLERRDPAGTKAEIDAAASWARERLFGPAETAAFSFLFGGRPSSQVLGSWERSESARDLDARREERRISYKDPATGLAIDLCASGGRRLDLESLSRAVPLWHSDRQCSGPDPVADQLQNAGLWRWIPMHGCGVFGLEPSYVFRSGMTTGNILCVAGAKGTLATAEPETEAAVARTVAAYKALRPYMVGDFTPLAPHDASQGVWFAYQFHRPDLQAGMAMAFRRRECAEASRRLQLSGLDPAARYRVRNFDSGALAEAAGRELIEDGALVEIPERPGAAILLYERW